MKKIIITKNEANQRLDKMLLKLLKASTKSFIYKMLRKKNIVLNGKKATGNELLKENDVVKLFLSDETFEKMSGSNNEHSTVSKELAYSMKKMIVYEDKDILVAAKPKGILSQKASQDDVSMNEYLISYMLYNDKITDEQLKTFRPSFVNRLDRNTTGIIIAGKSLMGLQQMTDIIKNRECDKYYLAVVAGVLKGKKVIKGYLVKNNNDNIVTIKDKECEGAVKIITEYESVKNNGIYTLVKIKLVTGKPHQIRAHLSSIGHPVVGDTKYGSKRVNDEARKLGINSQMLHSYEFVIKEAANTSIDELKGRSFTVNPPDTFNKLIGDKHGVL